jgi:diguanylate cyclase (GGDEF)-like protein
MAAPHARWDGDTFRDIDDSVATLLKQLFRAVAGMFVAYALARTLSEKQLGLGEDFVGFLLSGLVFAAFGAAAIYVTSARPIRHAIKAQRATIQANEAEMLARVRRQSFVADLQNALEMVETEEEAFAVVGAAFGHVAERPAELLLADSSRAHLRQAAVSHYGAAGCGVETPWSCPAVRRGQTLEFNSSTSLAACPKLRARGLASAVCVPVTVLGAPVGVMHMIDEPDTHADLQQVALLEGLALHAGSRIGVIRAISQSQLQAATDPVTGLLNRRRLDDELRQLRSEGTPFAIVFADLDHFKVLNDTYGHEAGDRALRLFARVLKSSVRDRDFAARHGGEEFVLVLPGTDATNAAPVVHRVRAGLARVVGTGEVPAFTASFGLADSTQADEPLDVLRLADAAMFLAKQSGRDQLVISDAGAIDPEIPLPEEDGSPLPP